MARPRVAPRPAVSDVAGAGLLSRLFGTGGQAEPDGQADELAAHATGITPVLLEPALPKRTLADAADRRASADAAGGRRQRPLAAPRVVVGESLGEKVLHAWLQNRYQTLYPLTVNLRTLGPRQADLLAQVMAVALLASSGTAEPAQVEAGASWLGSVGGETAALDALRAALETPPPLSQLIHAIQQADIAAYAYVVALAAGPSHEPAGQLFLDYLAARLGLPVTVVRSANHRYRR